jgi:heme oxygenase (biliverdin-IX-beta and delta-forming)
MTSNREPETGAVDEEAAARREAILDAHRLLRARSEGVLCTISKKIGGWPFGSVAPYALDRRGEPILYISTIAEHTKNLIADPRVSLLVQDDPALGDVQAHARITLMGRAERIPSDEGELEDARARYVARLPKAATYSETHDFHLWRVRVAHVRFIGGFGKIEWFEPREVTVDPAEDPLAKGAGAIVGHMNHDHADALVLYCRAFKNVSPSAARMIGVDQYGFDVLCRDPDVRLRFDFDKPATMETIRPIVVDLARRARAHLGEAR